MLVRSRPDTEGYTMPMPMAGMQHSETVYRLPMPAPPGQAYSEFNHHVAGIVVIILGVSSILLLWQPRRFAFLQYIWPISLMALGAYLILYSDPDSWPTANVSIAQSWADIETRQHKVYALILLLIGSIEFACAASWAKRPYWKFAFPTLAVIGALYLILHQHGGGSMHDMPGMEGMPDMPGMDESTHRLILYQHIIYILLGVQIAATKVLSDTRKLTGAVAPYIWPTLTILLGVALILYKE